MRLLLKHLVGSIRKRPLQPVILILTLALAVATAIFAFTIDDTIDDDLNAAQTEKYGNASLMIGIGNTSASRFLFVDDVVDVLGDSVKAAGCYELPLILDGREDTTVAVATEFERISDVFSIEFLKYGKVTRGSVCDSAFISADFAQKTGLDVGDTLSVETMGYTRSYRVEGISARPFLASYDVMVDIGSVMRAFANQSLLFAAIGEDFKPCNKIYVNIDACEGLDREGAVSALRADARFSEKIIEDLTDIEKRQSNGNMLDLIIGFAVAFAALLSAVIVFCCFYILANERAEENLALTYAGANSRLLGALQYTEVILYWMIGVPLGVLAAMPITGMIAEFVNLKYAEVTIGLPAVIKSGLIILAACLLTTTFFVVFNKRVKRTGIMHRALRPQWSLLLLGVIVILFALLYLLPAAARLVLYVMMIVAMVALIFLATPMVVRWISSAIERWMCRKLSTSAIAFRYALKNVCSLKLLHNIARLCALIVAIILTVGLMLLYGEGLIRTRGDVFDADYVVANATDSCYRKAQTCESAEAVYRAYLNQNGLGTVVSADDLSAYGEWLSVERQPTGNEVLISAGIAHRLDLRIGDSFLLELDGLKHEVRVIGIGQIGANYVVIDCESLGVPYNMLLVRGGADTSSADLLADLSQTTASELAPILSMDSLLEKVLAAMQTYMNAGKILLVVFVIFSLVGMADTFYESLRARREKFGFYRLAGMSRRELRLMKLAELVITVLLGLLIGAGMFVLSAFAVNRGMSGHGIEIFLGVKMLFL